MLVIPKDPVLKQTYSCSDSGHERRLTKGHGEGDALGTRWNCGCDEF